MPVLESEAQFVTIQLKLLIEPGIAVPAAAINLPVPVIALLTGLYRLA
jgi:hypothetical protein